MKVGTVGGVPGGSSGAGHLFAHPRTGRPGAPAGILRAYQTLRGVGLYGVVASAHDTIAKSSPRPCITGSVTTIDRVPRRHCHDVDLACVRADARLAVPGSLGHVAGAAAPVLPDDACCRRAFVTGHTPV